MVLGKWSLYSTSRTWTMSNILDAGVVRKEASKLTKKQFSIFILLLLASLPHLVRCRGPQHSARCSQRSSDSIPLDHMADAPTRSLVSLWTTINSVHLVVGLFHFCTHLQLLTKYSFTRHNHVLSSNPTGHNGHHVRSSSVGPHRLPTDVTSIGGLQSRWWARSMSIYLVDPSCQPLS
jgi:hypothetical protein